MFHECPVRRTYRKSSSKSGNLTGEPNGCWRKSNQYHHMILKGLSMAARRSPGHPAVSRLNGVILATRHPPAYSGSFMAFRLPPDGVLHINRGLWRDVGTEAPIFRRWPCSESCTTRRGWSLPLLRRRWNCCARATTAGRRTILRL